MGTRTKENEFSKPTIRALQDRVNGRCSNPECGIATRGPHSNGRKSLTVGDAAHITAAAVGGPRYDDSLSPEQRSDIENGIWLCKTCARLIDRDPEKFTTDLLRKWKSDTESAAMRGIGKRIKTDADVLDQVTQMVTAGGNTFQPSLLRNSIHAASFQMQKLDPRFQVTPEYHKGNEVYELTALENVAIGFTMPPAQREQFDQKLKEFIAHGTAVEIHISDWSVSGSRLIEQIFSDAAGTGILKLEPTRVRASELLISSTANAALGAITVVGTTTSGTESAVFKGIALGGLIEATLRFPLVIERGDSVQTTFSHRFEPWIGKQLASLPYISKLIKWSEIVGSDEPISFELEVEGRRVLRNVSCSSSRDGWDGMLEKLLYLEYLSDICRYVGSNATFNADVEFDADYFHWARHIALAIRAGGMTNLDIPHGVFDGEMEVNAEFLQNVENMRRSSSIKFIPDPPIISFGGQEIQFPRARFEYSNAVLKSPGITERLALGELVNLEWEVTNGVHSISLLPSGIESTS